MSDERVEAVYSMVERAFIRLQAGEVLGHCLEDGSTDPIHKLVEGLVLAGPQSLSALREIVAEVDERRRQLESDLEQIFSRLETDLKERGANLANLSTQVSLHKLEPSKFLAFLRKQGISEGAAQLECFQLLRDSNEMMVNLLEQIHLLEDVESYLEDWLWGLMYQTTRVELFNGLISVQKTRWLL